MALLEECGMFVLKADELGLQNEGFIGMGWLR
jgi:hypothetical protein